MSRWRQTLNVSDVFHNDAMTISEKAGVIADRIERLGWALSAEYVSELAGDLRRTTDAEGFDEIWNAIYDEADFHRVWVVTR